MAQPPAAWPAPGAFTLPDGPITYRKVLGFGLRIALGDILLPVTCGILGTLLALPPPVASQQIVTIAVHTADTAFLAGLLTVLAGTAAPPRPIPALKLLLCGPDIGRDAL